MSKETFIPQRMSIVPYHVVVDPYRCLGKVKSLEINYAPALDQPHLGGVSDSTFASRFGQGAVSGHAMVRFGEDLSANYINRLMRHHAGEIEAAVIIEGVWHTRFFGLILELGASLAFPDAIVGLPNAIYTSPSNGEVSIQSLPRPNQPAVIYEVRAPSFRLWAKQLLRHSKAFGHYFLYVLRHKWHVFAECARLRRFRLGIIHDLSKFRPSEFIHYALYFYGPWDEDAMPGEAKDNFDLAWLHHQHRNKHHWQYWILTQDEDEDKVLPMPDKYREEMLADWRGASIAITGEDNTPAWYEKNKHKIKLHPDTRKWIESNL